MIQHSKILYFHLFPTTKKKKTTFPASCEILIKGVCVCHVLKVSNILHGVVSSESSAIDHLFRICKVSTFNHPFLISHNYQVINTNQNPTPATNPAPKLCPSHHPPQTQSQSTISRSLLMPSILSAKEAKGGRVSSFITHLQETGE
jgi:hypothetical protein